MEPSAQQHLLPVVVIAGMVTVGLELKWSHFRELFAHPRLPVLGTLIHTTAFPAMAVALLLVLEAVHFELSEAAIIGMLLIASCPSGGFSNILSLIARANLPLSVTLTMVSTLLSFLSVPLWMTAFAWLSSALDQPVRLPILPTLTQLLLLIVIPIGLGMALRARWEAQALRWMRPSQKWSQIGLYVTCILIIAQESDIIIDSTLESLPWAILLCVLTVVACYGSGRALGMAPSDAVTVSLEGSSRNLAVAVLIAANVMNRPDIAILPTVYFVALILVALVFARFWRRLTGNPEEEAPGAVSAQA